MLGTLTPETSFRKPDDLFSYPSHRLFLDGHQRLLGGRPPHPEGRGLPAFFDEAPEDTDEPPPSGSFSLE
jgi:hypothetical protein